MVDPNTVARIVAAADLGPSDTVVEFGPGFGSLTFALADVVERVVAIEIDAGFVDVLRDRSAGRDDVEIIHADALRLDLAPILADAPGRLVANLPYNVATPLVMHALAYPGIQDAFVMVQREVGERWAAAPGERLRAAISVKLDLIAEVQIAFAIPRTVFFPVPQVDSVMVKINRRADAPVGEELTLAIALVEAAFAQRRKTLRNNLRTHLPLEVLERVSAEVGLNLSDRAETVPTESFRKVAAYLSNAGLDLPGVGPSRPAT